MADSTEDGGRMIKGNGHRKFTNYLVALIVTLLAFLLKIILIHSINWPESSLVLSTGTIVISAWYGGFGPGVFSTILNYLILDYFFISPGVFLIHNSLSQNLRITIFLVEGVLVSWLAESLHRARRNVEKNMVKISQSEQFFRSLTENVKDYAIFLVNPKGIIISWNEGVSEIIGYQSNEILGKHFSSIFIEPFKRKQITKILKLASSKGRYEIEEWKKRKDNSQFWANIIITKLQDQKNERVLGFSVIIRDLTNRKKIEDAKSDFLSIVSHELKTPLSISRIISEKLLKKYKNNSHYKSKQILSFKNEVKDLQDLDSELNRLTILVNDLLDISRIDVNKLALQTKRINITLLINSVVVRMRQLTGNKNIIFQDSSKIFLTADPNRLGQVLINLITNAVRYSPFDSGIKVSATVQSKSILITVKDQGPGIPQAQQKLIFERFYQAQEPTYRGFGLGLYISKKIIELHKGKIWVDSKVEEGSAFTFSLPITS